MRINSMKCTWQRYGSQWPNNKLNYWISDCGMLVRKKRRGLVTCPNCKKKIEDAQLKQVSQ